MTRSKKTFRSYDTAAKERIRLLRRYRLPGNCLFVVQRGNRFFLVCP